MALKLPLSSPYLESYAKVHKGRLAVDVPLIEAPVRTVWAVVEFDWKDGFGAEQQREMPSWHPISRVLRRCVYVVAECEIRLIG